MKKLTEEQVEFINAQLGWAKSGVQLLEELTPEELRDLLEEFGNSHRG